MSLLETNGDYQFAENVAEINRSLLKLNKALEEQMDFSRSLTAAVKQLTEVIDQQNEQIRKFIKDKTDDLYATENLRTDVVLK
ncbi:hypothetical protein [Butyrivibrio sp. AC2005]|uniref:hypothetical protein n=1 Tax=Butyrivibrio sp. AC2005 TaxID=1280672 RepID=UPI000425C427|nr:hypothetical protein [Butyrivibrio sp. AC2005]